MRYSVKTPITHFKTGKDYYCQYYNGVFHEGTQQNVYIFADADYEECVGGFYLYGDPDAGEINDVHYPDLSEIFGEQIANVKWEVIKWLNQDNDNTNKPSLFD
jgi:hypothetical protein